MKYLVVLLMVVMLMGCADKLTMQCPTCEISGTNDEVTYVCTDCTIDATVTEDKDTGLIQALLKLIWNSGE